MKTHGKKSTPRKQRLFNDTEGKRDEDGGTEFKSNFSGFRYVSW